MQLQPLLYHICILSFLALPSIGLYAAFGVLLMPIIVFSFVLMFFFLVL